MRILADVHNGDMAVRPIGGTQPSNTPAVPRPASGIASRSPPAVQGLGPPQDQATNPPQADGITLANDVPSHPAVQSELETSSGSGSNSATSTNLSTEPRPTLGVGVDPKEKANPPKVGPLAVSQPDDIQVAPALEDDQANISEDTTRSLRSEAKAPVQHAAFSSFVNSFAEFYNQERAEFKGLNSALHPLFTLDSATSKFKVDENQMTNRNLTTMNELMVEMKKKDVMTFDKNNENMKTILMKYAK